jgi:hypothetical protein
VCALGVCALVLIGVVTGCGSSSTAPKHTTATRTTTTATVPLAVRVREAIAACRKEVTKSRYIPASDKSAAQADCNGIKSGNLASLKGILKQACLNAVARLPSADQGPAALACKQVY